MSILTDEEADRIRKQKDAGAATARWVAIICMCLVLGVIAPVIVALAVYAVCPGNHTEKWAVAVFIGLAQMILTWILLAFAVFEISGAASRGIKENDSEVDEPSGR